MKWLYLTLLTLLALIAGACSAQVDVDLPTGNVELNTTIPLESESSATITDTINMTDTVMSDTVMTDTVMTDTLMSDTVMTDTVGMTGTEGMTETADIAGTIDMTETMATADTSDVTEMITDTADTAITPEPTPILEPTPTGTAMDSMTETVTADADMLPTPIELPADTSEMTMAELIQSVDAFSTLATAIDAAGVGDALTVAGPITLLAPANGAFDVIPAAELEKLLADPLLLADILQYHIIIDAADSAELARLNAAQSTSGQPIAITVGLDGEVFINDAQVVIADVQTANGVIHVINQVLVPPTIDLDLPAADPVAMGLMPAADESLEALKAADTSDQTIVEVVGSIRGLSTADTAIDAAGLTTVLEQAGPFTLFVPTDPAFDQLPAAQLEAILNDSEALANLLQYHLVLDTVTSGDLALLPTLLTASGETLLVTVEDNGQIFINGAPVYQSDIEAANGVIHVVGELITPLPE